MHVILCICACEFQDEILLRREECKTQVNLSFSKKNRANTMNLPLRYMLKTLKVSRSQMTKRTSLLGSLGKI